MRAILDIGSGNASLRTLDSPLERRCEHLERVLLPHMILSRAWGWPVGVDRNAFPARELEQSVSPVVIGFLLGGLLLRLELSDSNACDIIGAGAVHHIDDLLSKRRRKGGGVLIP